MIYNNLKNIKVVTQKVSQLFYDTIEKNSPIGNILNIIISESSDKNYPVAISYIVEEQEGLN